MRNEITMSEVRLTDFTVRQLELLLNGVVWQVDTDRDIDLLLLRTQILTALHFVKERDKVNNN